MDLMAKEYGVKLTGKTLAALNLAGTAAMVYGPKLLVVLMIKKQLRQQANNAPATTGPTAGIDPAGLAAAADLNATAGNVVTLHQADTAGVEGLQRV